MAQKGFSKGSRDKDGYLRICLTKNGKEKTFKIHRLVALHFIVNPGNKKQVNHKDGNKENNNDWNLEWNTPKENIVHSWSLGLSTAKIGSKNGCSKLKESDILEIRESNLTLTKLADKYNVSFSLIGQIKRRKIWTHI